MRTARSAILVDKGTFEQGKAEKTGHEDQDLRNQLMLIAELRKEQRELFKKAEAGQFWLTLEAADGDPMIAISKDMKKPVSDLDKLVKIKKTPDTEEVTGKWFNNPTNNDNFTYEVTKGNVQSNVIVNAVKAARVGKDTATPCPKAIDVYMKEQYEAFKKLKKK